MIKDEINNLHWKNASWSEIKDFSSFVTLLGFMAAEFEIISVIEFVKAQSKLDIAKNIVFYYLVAKFLLKIARNVYGYGLILSVQRLYSRIAKYCARFVLSLPAIRRKVDSQVAKIAQEIDDALIVKDSSLQYFTQLPDEGLSDNEIVEELDKYTTLKHNDWENGKVSGAVYHGGKDLIHLQALAFEKYCVSNQLHPDSFPGLRKMDSEVVSMVLNLFHAPKDACGTSSSGGTESLLLACLSAKTYARKYKGITAPEIIAPVTIHAGVDKACYYFGIKLHKVPLDSNYRGDIKYFRRLVNRNTVLLLGSAPNFPHGIIDDIQSLSALAVSYKIPLHVDCCLGSFIVSYVERSGIAPKVFPKFDFSLPGVTSISCDTHKYGFAPKGSSIIMYRTYKLRACQYYVSTDWVGGLYGSPTLSGSRPGALMAGCWATMVKTGDAGYKKSCREIVGAAQKFKNQIRKSIPELQIIGDPILSVISFKSDVINIYDLSDMLSKQGWHLNALQNPPALHVAFTVPSAKSVDNLIECLKQSVEALKLEGKGASKGDTAQLYGTAGSVSTNGVVDRVVEAFIDTLYK